MKNLKSVAASMVCITVLFGVLSITVTANEVAQSTLTVQGDAAILTVPDRAYITFSVRTIDDDPVVSQEQNRERSNEIYEALQEIEIELSDTRTQSYTMRRSYRWVTHEPGRGEHLFQGYETIHTIVVTLEGMDEDASLAGKVFDVSVAHGANQAEGVRFSLSNEKRKIVYLEALAVATERARTRANATAAILGISNIRPLTVNIENVQVNEQGRALVRTGWGDHAQYEWADSEVTSITPGQVSVRARVAITFTY